MVEEIMRFVAIIPARYGSTRLAAKPLRLIAGTPLIAHVVNQAKKVNGLDQICVATDHAEIAQIADSLGVISIMTDPQLPSGTDRVHAAAKNFDADVIFNIQGDEPLLNPGWVEALMREFERDSKIQMATVATDLDASEMDQLQVVKVITDKNKDSIYFSRYPIPYSRKSFQEIGGASLKHIGLYGYRRDFLNLFCSHPVTTLEQAESLEQLRAHYMGYKLRVVKVDGESVGVDTEDDVKKVEAILKRSKN